MPSTKPRGHKGGAHCGSKSVARDFEKLSVSKRDSPVRHPSRNRTIRPGQLQKVRAGMRVCSTAPHHDLASSSTCVARLQLTQARQMGNRAVQFKPTIGDNMMGFPKTAWCVAEILPVPA